MAIGLSDDRSPFPPGSIRPPRVTSPTSAVRRRRPRRRAGAGDGGGGRLDGEDGQGDPDQAEADPAAGRHVLVEAQDAERELQGRGEVLQQPEGHHRTRIAAPPKQISGTAVTMPVLTRAAACGRRRRWRTPTRPRRPASRGSAARPARSAASRRSGSRRADARLLLAQAVAAERERQHQRDPGRSAVVDASAPPPRAPRRPSPPTASGAAARRG